MDKKTGKLKTIIYVVLAVFAFNFLITLPILCAVNGVGILQLFHDKGIVIGLVIGFVIGLVDGLGFVFTVIFYGFVSGLHIELAFRLVYRPIFELSFELVLVYMLVYGLAIGVTIGLVFGRVFGRVRRVAIVLVYGLVYGFVILLVIGIVIGLVSGFTYRLISMLIFAFTFVLGHFAGFFSIRKLLPLLEKLPEAIKQTLNGLIHPGQLKGYPIGIAIVSFIIFYISTVVVFSLWYYVIYLENYSFFKIVDEIAYPVWWHFLYFSVVTIATVGYGDISPVGILPQGVVVVEILSGFALVAFYLATIFQIIARIEPKDESLQLQEKDRQISELISKIAKCNKQQDEIIELTKQNKQNRRRLRTAIMRKDWRQR